jgi:hypothetical protein
MQRVELMRYWFRGQGGHSAKKNVVRKNIEKLWVQKIKHGCKRAAKQKVLKVLKINFEN